MFKFVVDWIKQNKLLSLAIFVALVLLAFAYGGEIKTRADLLFEGCSKIAADISVLWNNLELSKQTIAKIAAAVLLFVVVWQLKTWLHFVIWFVLFFGALPWSESVTPIKSINGLLMLLLFWFGFLYPFWFLFKRIGLNFAAVKTHARLHIRLCLQVSIIALLCFLVLFFFIFLWRISVVLSLFVFAVVIGFYIWYQSMQQLEKTQIKQSLFEFIFHEEAQSLKTKLLNQLPESQKEYYQSHISWQFELAWVKAKIAWKQVELSQWFAKHRWFWVLISALFTLFVVYSLVPKEIPSVLQTHYNDLFISPSSAANAENLFIKAIGSDGAWTFIILVLGLFTAFVLWWFRDINKRHEIENARKDTNLKDFQQICQWAAGEHLKDRNPIVVYAQPQNEPPKIQTQSNEGLGDLNDTLRISAVHQLAAFVRGDFGEHFKRPAFVILKTLWLSLVEKHVKEWRDEFDIEQTYTWGRQTYEITSTPLAQAINYALVQKNGKVLRDHAKDLPNACFAGLNFDLPNVDQPIDLSGLNMSGINLMGADMNGILLQRAILTDAQLAGSNLYKANLIGSKLDICRLNYSCLTKAQLNRANLAYTQLKQANLQEAILCNADLTAVNLTNADLLYADLHKSVLSVSGSSLWVPALKNADLSGTNLQDLQILGSCFFHPKESFKGINTAKGFPVFDHIPSLWSFKRAGLRLSEAQETQLKQWRETTLLTKQAGQLADCLDIGSLNKNASHKEIKEWLSPLWCVDDDCRPELLEALIEAFIEVIKKRLE